MKRVLLSSLPAVAFLVLWQLASGRVIKTIYVSKPTDIAQRLWELFATGEIWPHLATTAQELALGYLFGVLAGLVLGYTLARAPRLARVAEPYVMGFYGIPKIALAPLFIIWFGIGIWSKVALAGLMVFFLMFYNVYAGVRGVDRESRRAGPRHGRRRAPAWPPRHLPAATPFILLGMRMAIPYAVIGVIVGEFTSSTKGLGLFIHYASDTYDPAGVFAGIALLLAFVVLAGALAARLEGHLLRWRPPLPDHPEPT